MAIYCSIDGNTLTSGHSIDALINDRGLAYGHGLFETILLSNGNLPLLSKHIERICRDAPKVGISVESEHIRNCLEQFIDHLSVKSVYSGVVKIVLTAGTGGRGYATPEKIKPSVICTFSDLPRDLFQQRQRGIAVRCCHYKLPINPALAGIKHLNRLDQIIARAEWRNPDYSEGLIFSTEDILVEAISANVFLKQMSGDWLTPDISVAGVSGVMRSLLLEEVFSDCGIEVKVSNITKEQLSACEELFVCNSIRGIVPVTAIYSSNEDLIKSLPIGKDTQMLQTILNTEYTEYL